MKTCFTTFSLQTLTLRETIEIAATNGLRGIELRGKENTHISPDSPKRHIHEAKRMLEEAGLEVPCITAYMRFAQADQEGARRQAADAARYADLCAELGAKAIRAFMGAFPEGVEPERVKENAVFGLNLAAEALHGSGVSLLIETHDSVKSGALLKPYLDQTPDEIGALLDIIHPYDMNESIQDTLALIGSRIRHVHIKDISSTSAEGRVYCRIGDGLLNVAGVVRALLANSYAEYFCLEWEKSVPETSGVSFEAQLESFISMMAREDPERANLAKPSSI